MEESDAPGMSLTCKFGHLLFTAELCLCAEVPDRRSQGSSGGELVTLMRLERVTWRHSPESAAWTFRFTEHLGRSRLMGSPCHQASFPAGPHPSPTGGDWQTLGITLFNSRHQRVFVFWGIIAPFTQLGPLEMKRMS